MGFLSHDIGELVVSKELLNQRSTLNPLERKIIRQIQLHGVNVLKEAGCDYPLAVDIVMNHHERVDGQGYPRGLFKHRIPLIAQVCAICESFDTMTTPQPYRHGSHTAFEALNHMSRERPGQFDLLILSNFIRMMGGNLQPKTNGTPVNESNDSLVIVRSR